MPENNGVWRMLWFGLCGHPAPVSDPLTIQTRGLGHTCLLKDIHYFYVAKSKHKLNSPIWDTRVLKAVHLVLIIHSHILLLITALLEHHVSLLFVERAAHPTVCWMHWEDCWATYSLALPYALLDHAWNKHKHEVIYKVIGLLPLTMLLTGFGCDVHEIKAG